MTINPAAVAFVTVPSPILRRTTVKLVDNTSGQPNPSQPAVVPELKLFLHYNALADTTITLSVAGGTPGTVTLPDTITIPKGAKTPSAPVHLTVNNPGPGAPPDGHRDRNADTAERPARQRPPRANRRDRRGGAGPRSDLHGRRSDIHTGRRRERPRQPGLTICAPYGLSGANRSASIMLLYGARRVTTHSPGSPRCRARRGITATRC